MEDNKILDIAHISFLDMIKVMISMNGAANAKGTLIRNALNTADKMPAVAYDSFEAFLAAIESTENPLTRVEGKATHINNFVFGLKRCPFSLSIANYKKVFARLPDGYDDFTQEFNKRSMVTDKYRIGEGAGVSPFCAVHQSMRSALADKITIGGRPIRISQLGCKSGDGRKGLAEKWIEMTGASRELVDLTLDNNMCCYHLHIEA
jgi:hypothetical protein